VTEEGDQSEEGAEAADEETRKDLRKGENEKKTRGRK